MSITIKDIAKLAGVSHTTVSRVLNHHPNVKPETRKKVLEIIEKLNYQPHDSARALVSGKTYNIGLLVLYDVQQFPADFLSSVLIGITSNINQMGYNITLFFDQVRGLKNKVALEKISKNNMEGLFVLSVENDAELVYKIGKIDLPIVLVNQRIKGLNVNCVAADDEGGAYKAVSHLLDMGHKSIAFIGGHPRYSTSEDRRVGYEKALVERGIDIKPSLEKMGNFEKEGGYAAMNELLDQPEKITAVFAANDNMALGAIRAIKERKLRVPQDIAVVGFDDADFSSDIDPPLTTVKKPRDSMGRLAADIMIKLLSGKGDARSQQIILPTTLIVRKSSDFVRK